MMTSGRCSSCGQALSTGAGYCPNCGSHIENVAVQPAAAAWTGAAPSSPFVGNNYIVEQKLVAIRDTYGIKDTSGNLLAYVKKEIVSFGPKFWFEGVRGERLGEMHGKVLSVRPTFEIYNEQGTLLAAVKKKILKLLGSEWWMENSSGQEIARIKGNIMEHDYRIETPSGIAIAQLHKKWVTIRDSYGVEILDRSIHPYLTLSYVIAMDHAEHKESKSHFGLRLVR